MEILKARQSYYDQAFVCHVSIHCIDKQHNILMSATNANRVSHSWASQNTELWEPNIYIWVFFFENSIKFLQVIRLLQVAKFLFMYSFTHTNIVCFFKHLPTESAIFKNVCYQRKCFSGDGFSFFRNRFC